MKENRAEQNAGDWLKDTDKRGFNGTNFTDACVEKSNGECVKHADQEV